ncbi:MAG TPA: T9SS type A sorting domain-containing protein, partial [Bacteroidales bacterium]|nr:T9SS type A sorting domain-containing protein [Bacteroidales bacterium]
VTVTISSAPDAVTVSGDGTYCTSTTLTATGGTGGVIYWQGTTSGGTSTATPSTIQTVTASGTYYFRAYNSCVWGTQGSATVTINYVPEPVNVLGGGSICSGTSTPLIATGGTNGTIYWQGTTSGGTSTATPSTMQVVSAAGTYYFRALNNCGWGQEGSAMISINTLPSDPSPSATPSVICSGGSSSLSAAVPGTTIYWFTGSCGGIMIGSGSPLTVTPASATTYYARAFNATTGCWSSGCGSVTVTISSAPDAVTVSGDGTYCTSATLTATGGTGGTIYWQGTTSGGTSTATPSTIQTVTASGTYYFRAFNSCVWGPQGSATVTINYVPGVVTVTGGGTFCTSATLTATGGTNGTIYWQGTTGDGTSTANASTSQVVGVTGTYYFRALNNCGWGPAYTGTSVVIYPTTEPTPVASPPAICGSGSTNLSASVPGSTIYWYIGSCGGSLIGTGNSITVTPVTTTTYYARAYNPSCSSSCGTVTVVVSDPIPQTISGYTTPVCTGLTEVLTSTTSGGTWMSSDPGLATIDPSSGLVNYLSDGNVVITYTVTVGGCTNTASASITISVPMDQTITGTSLICVGSSETWTSTTTGGTWSSDTPGVATVDALTGLVTGISDGTAIIMYSVTVGGCVNTATQTVTISTPIPQTITGNQQICLGSSEIWTSTTTGGTWTIDAPGVATIDASTGLVTGVSSGTAVISYSITIGGCINSATQSVTITAPIDQTITGSTLLCVGSTDSWTATTSGGVWTSDSPGVASVDPLSGVVTGISDGTAIITYSVTVGGCVNTATKSVTITDPMPQTLTGLQQICTGLSATWTSTTYGGTWISDNPGVAAVDISTGVVTGISEGTTVITYSITIGGCVNTAAQTVTITDPLPQTITGTSMICVGSAETWTSTTQGGIWTSDTPGVATADPLSGVVTGISDGSAVITYSITVGGCINTATQTATITAPFPQTINGLQQICAGSTTTWTSSTYGGTWTSDNIGVATVDPSSGLVTGVSGGACIISYSLTIGGCVNTATQSVTVTDPIPQIISGTTPVCIGSNTIWTSTTTGGIWASDNPSIATIEPISGMVTGVAAGSTVVTYTVTVGACSNTATQMLTITEPILQTLSGNTPICIGSSENWTSTSTGGTWTSSDPATATVDASTGLVTGVAAGTSLITYSVSIGACVNTATKTVTIANDIDATISGGTSPICYNSDPGTFTATGTGGTGVFTYQWYKTPATIITNATNSTYNPGNITSSSGYYCEVTGSCGSITTDTVDITVYPFVTATLSGGNSQICDKTSPGTLTATGNGGTGVYTYLWHKDGISTGVTTSTYNPGLLQNDANFYCVVTDYCGVATTNTFYVVILPPVGIPTPITVSAGIEPICQLTNDTTVTYYSTTAQYSNSFNWSISDTNAGWIDANLGVMHWNNGYYGNVNIQVSANGCDGPSIEVYRAVVINLCGAGHSISGKTKYAAKANNGIPAPNPATYNSIKYNIDNVIVILKDYSSGNELARDTSDASGVYQFNNVADGNYILSYDKYTVDTMQWGNDVNAIDLTIIKYYIGTDTMSDPSRNFYPKYRKAANVDNNSLINAIDISRIKAKIGAPYSISKNFPKGNWVKLDTSLTVAGANLSIDLKTICYGDYNASSTKYRDSLTTWSMAKSLPENIIAVADDYVTINDPKYFEVPLRISSKMNEFSALGLELNYQSNDYRLVSAYMPKTNGKNGMVKINPSLEEIIAEDNDLLVTDEGGVIRVVYATTNDFDVAADDEMIMLGFSSINKVEKGELDFVLSGTGVIGNKYGEENEDAYLSMPKVFLQGDDTEAGFEFSGYPNPFTNVATLTYSLPENGNVKVRVYNAIGELVNELVNEVQSSGKHTVEFSQNNLPAGMYTFRLEFTGSEKSNCLVLKLVH